MKNILLVLVAVLSLSSCVNEILDTADKVQNFDEVQWNPTIAAPLVYSKLTLKSLLNEAGDLEFLRIEPDGGMTLVYANEYQSQTAEEVITLDDQSYSETFNLTSAELALLNTNGSVTVSHNRTLDFIIGGVETDRIVLKGGSFDMGVSSTLQHDIAVSFKLLDGTKNAQTFEETVNANYTGALPNAANISSDLNGLDIDFTNTPQTHSQMRVELSLTITKKGSNPIKPLETVTYNVGLRSMQFAQAFGFFETKNFSSASDVLELDFFKNNSGGSFTLADPRIKFVLSNSLGFPIDARVLKFEGTNSDNNTVSLNGYPTPFPIPNLTMAEVGMIKKDSFTLNKTTSNLADYINNRPYLNAYEISVNSLETGTDRHWVLDTSRLAVRVEIEVPLEGTARDYILESTQPWEVDFENADEIKEVVMRLYTENGFPADVAMQLYFEDSITNKVLDSLISTDILILPAASIDGSGKVTTPNPKVTDIVIDNVTTNKILNANRMRLKAYFNTPFDGGGQQPNVKFYDSYGVLIQLGVQAEVLINQGL